MAPRRQAGTIVVGLALALPVVVGVSVAVWAAGLQRDAAALGDALVSRVNALPQSVPRPSHLEAPDAGSFGEALEPVMEELRPRVAALKEELDHEVQQRCGEVSAGERPFPELEPACLAALETDRALVARALMAARRAEAGMPEGLRAISDPAHPHQRDGFYLLQHVARSTALDARRLLVEDDADAALELCVDGLAFGRDLGYGGGLLGAMVSVASTGVLHAPCEQAAREASAPVRRRAGSTLRHVRAGLAPLSAAMREEAAYGPLLAFGGLLEEEQRAALPAEAVAVIEESAELDPSLWQRLLMLHAWRVYEPLNLAVVEAVDLPRAAREPRLAELQRASADSFNPILRMGSPSWARFADEVEQQRTKLDELIAAAGVDL